MGESDTVVHCIGTYNSMAVSHRFDSTSMGISYIARDRRWAEMLETSLCHESFYNIFLSLYTDNSQQSTLGIIDISFESGKRGRTSNDKVTRIMFFLMNDG